MRAVRLSVMLVVLLALAGCASSGPSSMPDVTGKKLNVAKSDIKKAGFGDKVDVTGGGAFGILNDSNWEVCEQSPAAGAKLSDTPHLKVARSCSAEPAEASPAPTQAPSEQPATAKPDDTSGANGIDAKAIEAKFIDHLHANSIDSIGAMCDAVHTHWACFYDGVANGTDYLRVNLTTDGVWSAEDLDDMANKAGRHWFNFIGCDFPQLATIVVNINGIDHNVFRTDIGVLCN